MNNNEMKEESYKCQICGKEAKNSVDAITHYLDHGSSALNAVNALIKDQRTGSVTTEDRARVDAKLSADIANAQKDKRIIAVQEAK
ncbi:MAG: hypothetical protein ABR981_01660 [Candidatus Micrarchaeaceae archaeon]|jgi:hypothetical protein